ncbi:MAG: hypothetical protein ACKVP0_02205 [Pirellulaceae bacterium]
MKYSLWSLMMAAFDDPQESRFRRRLKQRVSEPCPNYGVAEAALRRVFEEQLDLPNLLSSDDLVENGPDLPIDEILQDALELLGINAIPTYDSWNGTFGDLVRVLDEVVAKIQRTYRPGKTAP